MDYRQCLVLMFFSGLVAAAPLEIAKGKSNVINDTDETISIDYSICHYDYDSVTKTRSNESCKPFRVTLEPGNIESFTLNPSATEHSNITHYQKIWIKKIIGKTAWQYFIADAQDSASYYQYRNKPYQQGVQKSARYCTFFYEVDTHIIASGRGFLCYHP